MEKGHYLRVVKVELHLKSIQFINHYQNLKLFKKQSNMGNFKMRAKIVVFHYHYKYYKIK